MDWTPAVLMLSDGTVFEGRACGALGTTMGELCFNTGMTGYQEIFSDPSYLGQIITMTTPHIGNYGAVPQEMESDSPRVAGVVIRSFSELYSRAGQAESLQAHLARNGVVGISGIDTRSLVRHIRERGAMNAIISSETTHTKTLLTQLAACPSMEGQELSSKVSTHEPYWTGPEDAALRVAALDLGMKRSITTCLTDRGLRVKVFPAKTPAQTLLAEDVAGFFLSNGPGDPAIMDYAIETAKSLIESRKPVFGICLGHQIIALAAGAQTEKMRFGHHGTNHPVKNLLTGKSEITSQNHGFVVREESLKPLPNVEVTHRHLNDNSVAGLRLKDRPVLCVQYHPEAGPGPHDSRYLFDHFVELLAAEKLDKTP
ncbi:MAG: glutamine-hydrolyzing carbamoyl-phosphate synthase small subunit [Bacteroidetes bacterium]|jgi:carbamoyl-phosphate synthase small subunit|nr:glutamine-hydrolyzing carbamoyl-phosphate synthase small subunit [Bacteroidota bacterium]